MKLPKPCEYSGQAIRVATLIAPGSWGASSNGRALA